jgi:hypothetical protein
MRWPPAVLFWEIQDIFFVISPYGFGITLEFPCDS